MKAGPEEEEEVIKEEETGLSLLAFLYTFLPPFPQTFKGNSRPPLENEGAKKKAAEGAKREYFEKELWAGRDENWSFPMAGQKRLFVPLVPAKVQKTCSIGVPYIVAGCGFKCLHKGPVICFFASVVLVC